MTAPDDDLEQSLRKALSAAAGEVEPAPDGLERILARTSSPPQPWLLAMASAVITRGRNWVWRGHWAWPRHPAALGCVLRALRGYWTRPAAVLGGVGVLAAVALAITPVRQTIVQASSAVLTGGQTTAVLGPGHDSAGIPAGNGTRRDEGLGLSPQASSAAASREDGHAAGGRARGAGCPAAGRTRAADAGASMSPASMSPAIAGTGSAKDAKAAGTGTAGTSKGNTGNEGTGRAGTCRASGLTTAARDARPAGSPSALPSATAISQPPATAVPSLPASGSPASPAPSGTGSASSGPGSTGGTGTGGASPTASPGASPQASPTASPAVAGSGAASGWGVSKKRPAYRQIDVWRSMGPPGDWGQRVRRRAAGSASAVARAELPVTWFPQGI